MKNIEKYYEILRDIASDVGYIGTAVVNNKPKACLTVTCCNCDFYDDGHQNCNYALMDWLNTEWTLPRKKIKDLKVGDRFTVSDDFKNCHPDTVFYVADTPRKIIHIEDDYIYYISEHNMCSYRLSFTEDGDKLVEVLDE